MAKFNRIDRRVTVSEKILSIHDAYEKFLISRKSRCSEASIRIYNEKRKPIEDFQRYGAAYMEEITPIVIQQY